MVNGYIIGFVCQQNQIYRAWQGVASDYVYGYVWFSQIEIFGINVDCDSCMHGCFMLSYVGHRQSRTGWDVEN